MIKNKQRIKFRKCADHLVSQDRYTLNYFSRNFISEEEAIRRLELNNRISNRCDKITHERLIANVFWLGYGNVYIAHHTMSDKDKSIMNSVLSMY